MKLFAKGAVAVAVALSLGVANAACNVDKWDVKNAQAKSATDGASRYEGLCALDGATGMVEKNINGSTKTFYRVFVFVEKAETNLTIFKATDGTNNAELKLNGENAEFGGKTAKVNVGKWNEIEVGLDAGKTSLKVNKGTAVAGTTTLSGATTKISLGKVAGTPTGKLFFDAFIASNDTAIPADASVSLEAVGTATMIPGDSNGKDGVSSQDVAIIRKELFSKGKAPAIGVPDCNLSGDVSSQDIACIRKYLFSKKP